MYSAAWWHWSWSYIWCLQCLQSRNQRKNRKSEKLCPNFWLVVKLSLFLQLNHPTISTTTGLLMGSKVFHWPLSHQASRLRLSDWFSVFLLHVFVCRSNVAHWDVVCQLDRLQPLRVPASVAWCPQRFHTHCLAGSLFLSLKGSMMSSRCVSQFGPNWLTLIDFCLIGFNLLQDAACEKMWSFLKSSNSTEHKGKIKSSEMTSSTFAIMTTQLPNWSPSSTPPRCATMFQSLVVFSPSVNPAL